MSAISLIQESINEAIEHNQPVGNLSLNGTAIHPQTYLKDWLNYDSNE